MITMGCDIGSLFAKAVVMDDDWLIGAHTMRTTGDFSRQIDELIGTALNKAGKTIGNVQGFGATGNGAKLVTQADFHEDSFVCVGAAIAYFMPDVHYAVDVGGQSIACLAVNGNGEVANILRNDKCASGSGRFLEMACNKLNVDIAQLDDVVARATKELPISNQCGVFAESEVITYVNAGECTADIVAGVCDALVRIVSAQCRRFGFQNQFTLVGGVTRLIGIVERLSRRIEAQYQPFPFGQQLAAAIGAALLEEDN